MDETHIVVRDSMLWRALWVSLMARSGKAQSSASDSLPQIDFAREMIVVLGRGRNGCGLPAPDLPRLYSDPRDGVTYALVYTPTLPPGAGCLPDITEPVLLVATERSEQPIHFIETQ